MLVATGGAEMYKTEFSLKKARRLGEGRTGLNTSFALLTAHGRAEEEPGHSLSAIEVKH